MRREATARIRRKELQLLFTSPAAWLFLIAFAGGSLFIVFWVESFFARNIADLKPLFSWMPLLLIPLCAALSMRMWSEERRDGTLEHVLTQATGLWPFVLGKFQACLVMLALSVSTTLPLALTLSLIANLDWGPVVAGYLATLLLGAAYLSIGLWVSAHTNNAIVALIGSTLLCSVLYLLGDPLFTGFFANDQAEIMRLLASGTRFESISRGVLDLRDLFYYLSLCLGFLLLTQFALERSRWSGHAFKARHREAWLLALLIGLNLFAANYWLQYMHGWRLDLTRDQRFSMSDSSRQVIDQLEEPLLIRGYFSQRTHPRLAPLIPQLKDLLREFEVAGNGKIRLELVDPAEDPALEDEANRLYNIQARPVQISDRHQSSIINAYFNVLVQYGDEFQTLDFGELVEVKMTPHAEPEILLRNPEFDIARAIKAAYYSYRRGSRVFDAIDDPVEFIGYVSRDEALPPELRDYLAAIRGQLRETERRANGKFSVRFIEPEAQDGVVARQIADQWGFEALTADMDSDEAFYFYLTLANSKQVVQLPTDDFSAGEFRSVLQAGLRRFASNMTRTVALVTPTSQAALPGMANTPSFQRLEQSLARDYNLLREDLRDGTVFSEADALLVLSPENLEAAELYAIDQFLMRGGTVILTTSPLHANLAEGELSLQSHTSGIEPWLAHHGVRIEETLVLDRNSASFITPTQRQSGDYEFDDVRIVNYPYFIDLRRQGLSRDHPITTGLYQATMAWASPLLTERREGLRVAPLLRSSQRSWTSDHEDIAEPPEYKRGAYQSSLLGVALQGRMQSYFRERPPLATGSPAPEYFHHTVQRSPESARLVVYSSNDFLRDQVLNIQLASSGNPYLGALELMLKSVDWALDDSQLSQIRSRGGFSNTLPPMDRQQQTALEYFNYGAAALWVLLLVIIQWLAGKLRLRRYRRELSL